jgi:pimeloyl-ACP methyl ester carboxylesterase
MVRTDMIVNWTIQRAFPWAWIAIFLDQIHVPCTIFLSDKDALVPAEKVEAYFRSNNVPISDASEVGKPFFDTSGDVNAVVFRGGYHGSFTEEPELVPPIALACMSLCDKVEARDSR